VEVCIPPFFPTPPKSSEADASSANEELGEGSNTRPTRRAAAQRTTIVISDDDDEPHAKSKAKRSAPTITRKKAAAKSKKVNGSSSDYEASEQESSDDEIDDNSASSEDDSGSESEPKPKKGKAATKGRTQRKVKKSEPSDEDDDDMEDASDLDAKATTGTKRKAGKGKSVTSKKQKGSTGKAVNKKATKPREHRETKDPWGLKGPKVRDDWTEMKCPPLEMFHWARLVIDEYTYIDGKILSLIMALCADRRWILSGTPPVHDFAAVKTIARLLHLHLGVDDEDETQSKHLKKQRRAQQTGVSTTWAAKTELSDVIKFIAVEKFHSFREMHSLDWHAHRHDIAQGFLDRFVRQVCLCWAMLD
jgi:hypothetical protein